MSKKPVEKIYLIIVFMHFYSISSEIPDPFSHDIKFEIIKQIVHVSEDILSCGKTIRNLQSTCKSWKKTADNQSVVQLLITGIAQTFSVSPALAALCWGSQLARTWLNGKISEMPKDVVSKDIDYSIMTFDLHGKASNLHHKKNILKYLSDYAFALNPGKRRIKLGDFSRLEVSSCPGIDISFYENGILKDHFSAGELSIHYIVVSPQKFFIVIDHNGSLEWNEYSLMQKSKRNKPDQWNRCLDQCEDTLTLSPKKRRSFYSDEHVFFYYWYKSALDDVMFAVLRGNINSHDLSWTSLINIKNFFPRD